MDVAVLKLLEMHQAKVVAGFGFTFRLRNRLHSHPKFHVLANSEPWEKTEFLKDQNPVRARPLNWRVVNQHLAGCLLMKTSDQVKQRGLSAPRRPNNAQKLARPNLKIDVLERGQPVTRVGCVVQGNIFQ